MAYAGEYFYVTFGGTICQDEIWQCGIKFATDGNEDIFQGAFDQISVSDIFEDVRQWFVKYDASTGPASGIGAPCTLGWANLAAVDRNGEQKYDGRRHTPTTAATPAAVGVGVPQVCYVVTLWSGENIRRANYGRFYVPQPILGPQYVNGRLSSGNAQNMARGAIEMINAINGEVSTVGLGTYPAVMSHVALGETKRVEKVAVGRVLDTQRRRRNKLVEQPVYIDL